MKRWLGFIAAVLALICVSCLFGTEGGNDDQPDRTTVLGTLNHFPSDVGGDVPSSWGYDEEMGMFTNLATAVGGENVDVQLDLSEVTEPEEGSDTCSLNDIAYLMYVYLPEFDDVLKAEGWLDLYLEKRDGGWIVTEWRDYSILHLPGVYETSWGGVKGYFMGDGDE
jgi:hypothetical protein